MPAAEPLLSPSDIASAIGVSESSVKRWIDEERIRAVRTAGGHRRVPLRELVRYLRQTGLPIVNPQVLGIADLWTSSLQLARHPDAAESLCDAIKEGRAEDVRALLLSLYLHGRSLPDIFDGPISRALHEIGELWRHGPQGIHLEHRATDITLLALHHLRTLLPRTARDAPLALGGAPAGDPYLLPSLMATVVLADAGWHAINLGPDLPLPALADAIARHQPALVWLSCSVVDPDQDRPRQLAPLLKSLARRGSVMVVGGRGWNAPSAPAHPALKTVDSMRELAAFLEGVKAAGAAN